MVSTQKRSGYLNLIASPRLDSRLLLRALIALNIVLAVYNIISLQSSSRTGKSSPCVIVINTSKDSTNTQKSTANVEPAKLDLANSDVIAEQNNDNKVNVKSDKPADKESAKSEEVRSVDEPLPPNRTQPIWWSTETRQSYTVLKNYIPGERTVDPLRSVTLTTQGTFSFLYHAENLCQRWDGPVSIAVYAPGTDFALVVNLVYYLRKCKDECVRANTSWHMVFNTAYGPKSNQSFPQSYVEDFDCSLSFDDIVDKFSTSFKSDHSLPYPINVVRNVARLNAQTQFIFASDIELYPSVGIVSSFMELLDREKSGQVSVIKKNSPHVYVIPIFEVKAGVEPPKTKSELNPLFKAGKAIFFHKWVCDACQNFPDRDKWIDVNNPNNSLNIFRVTRRLRSRNTWEPLYIGTNSEPLYDERLTWDGKRDKMSQMYEMCLMGYDLAILDNAFLVHAPGIKHIDPKEEKKRLPFIKRNNMVYNTILAKLRKKYQKYSSFSSC